MNDADSNGTITGCNGPDWPLFRVVFKSISSASVKGFCLLLQGAARDEVEYCLVAWVHALEQGPHPIVTSISGAEANVVWCFQFKRYLCGSYLDTFVGCGRKEWIVVVRDAVPSLLLLHFLFSIAPHPPFNIE